MTPTYLEALVELEAHANRIRAEIGKWRNPFADIELLYVLEDVMGSEGFYELWPSMADAFSAMVESGFEIDLADAEWERRAMVAYKLMEIGDERGGDGSV
jgi:hypothetical protein